MKQTKILMGMHITIEVVDRSAKKKDIDKIFDYFRYIDNKFSTYKKTSEISKINRGMIQKNQYSMDMKKILLLCKQTTKDTNGYFDIFRNGKLNPSGIVKGWAILKASELLKKNGFKNFYIDAGGDIQIAGRNQREPWKIGIKNPFNQKEIIKSLVLYNKGIATSGNYIRGNHIYNPKNNKKISGIVSLTVIGPNIYEADRFATAAFAMESNGISFIENLSGFEGYMVDNKGIATYTTGFNKFVL